MFDKLSNVLGKFKRKDGLSQQIEIAQVLDRARAEIKKLLPKAEGVEVVSLKNKVLSIQIPNSNLASELRLRDPEIISQINLAFGKQIVSRVIYRF